MTPNDAATKTAILANFESLMRHVAQRHAPEFLEIDVTMSQVKVLYMVSVRPDTNMSMVAAQLHVGLSAVSGLVDRLVEHGLLTRNEDPADRRQHLLNVSPKGARVLERVRELNTAHLDRLLAGLSTPELEALRDGISALERESGLLDGVDTDDAEHDERTSA
jgi:DNA-binding MarR family transcriptional regulator